MKSNPLPRPPAYGATVDPMAESDASGNLTNEYIFLGGARIAMLTISSGAVNYYVADHLGSSRIVASSSGSVLDDSDFYPFGGERSYASSSGNNYKFTGKECDTESGLDDFAARFYTSSYGRFLSPDDSKYMHPADPQTFNLYSYVANNPINAVDPTGHDQEGPGSIQWRRSNMHMDGGGPTQEGSGGSVEAEMDPTFLASLSGNWGDDDSGGGGEGKTKAPTAKDLANSIPQNVKDEMQRSLDDSNSDGFHEEGGDWGTNSKGDVDVQRWSPGDKANPANNETPSIIPFHEAKADKDLKYTGDWHVHPKGTAKDKNNKDHGFIQEPSGFNPKGQGDRDIDFGKYLGGTHVVIAARDERVYFYNANKIIGSVSFKSFGLK